MGHFVSIRGWLALWDEMKQDVQAVLKYSTIDIADSIGMSHEEAELYNKGWHFPDGNINWTYYCFYGVDIRKQHLEFIKSQLVAITAKVSSRDEVYIELFKDKFESEQELLDYPEGCFFVDDEDGDLSLMWKIENGNFYEISRPQ